MKLLKHPRNHYSLRDYDSHEYLVYLNGKLQKYAREANIRGKWVVRYVTDAQGMAVQDSRRPWDLLLETVYGKVTVEKKDAI